MTPRTLADLEAERIAGTPDEGEAWLCEFRHLLGLIADVMREDDERYRRERNAWRRR